MSFGFLALSIFLFISVFILIKTLNLGKKKLVGLSSAFSSEANHLICILVFFCSTYILRFVSDYWILPKLEDEQILCTIDDHETICVTTAFILYYGYSSLLFDFAPIAVIIYFHHKSFKNDIRSRSQNESNTLISTD